jgi:cobalamin biosynthesis Mg chelatase CobN
MTLWTVVADTMGCAHRQTRMTTSCMWWMSGAVLYVCILQVVGAATATAIPHTRLLRVPVAMRSLAASSVTTTLEGVQMILTLKDSSQSNNNSNSSFGTTQTVVEDPTATNERCDDLWAKAVTMRMQKQAEMTLVDFDTVDFILENIQKKEVTESHQISYQFDVVANIQAPTSQTNMTLYVHGPFDTLAAQTAFLAFLRRTNCTQFHTVESMQLMVPKSNSATSTASTSNSTTTTQSSNATTVVAAKAQNDNDDSMSNGMIFTLVVVVLFVLMSGFFLVFHRPTKD